MCIEHYFTVDDGSLPEIEVRFAEPSCAVDAFSYLVTSGAEDVSVGGSNIWVKHEDTAHTFSGTQDTELVISGAAEPFHIVLGNIRVQGVQLPCIGVWFDPTGLVLDYRMGSEWGPAEIQALLRLLLHFKGKGAAIAVPCWGAEGELAFRQAMGSTLQVVQPGAIGSA